MTSHDTPQIENRLCFVDYSIADRTVLVGLKILDDAHLAN